MLYITHAQLVEIIYCLEILIELIDEALDRVYPKREIPDIKPKAGSGVGTVEAPRGLLIHEYEIDKDGMVVGGNMIIPTTMNQLYMEEAIWKAIPPLIEDGARDDELKFRSEMIMRAFDPCISCSVHLMRL
jgi:sulfhydrogenase subunit alpha